MLPLRSTVAKVFEAQTVLPTLQGKGESLKMPCSNLASYFGEDGPFANAAALYQRRRIQPLPAMIEREAARLGDPKEIGYRMGWCFAKVLDNRGLTISDECLEEIGKGKFPLGGPQPFLAGFRAYRR